MKDRNNNKRQLYICLLKNILIVFLFFCNVNIIHIVNAKILLYYKKTECTSVCTDHINNHCTVCQNTSVATVTYGKQGLATPVNCVSSNQTRCDTRYYTHNSLEIFFRTGETTDITAGTAVCGAYPYDQAPVPTSDILHATIGGSTGLISRNFVSIKESEKHLYLQ